ncbi:MAG: hypothetical protein A2Z62_02655 [Candidatus Terrybacteria bacterium RIFCSPLOWO2_02_42_20]|uniref:DUF91 domain-containing protein n=2 Tax=Candidatus Terryibacteriota TaxID=1817920 RepID=A0A1G2PUV0_9BACT|nr:MAG: hypothetical protein A2W59_01735 [Candidatus Terrybacteria bacterium RIFCSPHIGHO2_02_41_19]OHA53364.1 MAG: hypothetical protein A2Z62_02655 [Candidatus Terrybacteria bacterium RIFCSPLOWO2_02_42_20]
MAIIISQDGKNAQKIDKSDFEKEGYLQNYIHENPESIPVYEIEEDKKLFVVAREFPTESGPIDALAIDKDGDIYVVETKLYKNPDKRTVVAQALDYGASLWRHSDYNEFINKINNEINNKFQISFEEKTKDFFNIDEEQVNVILEAIKRNLQKGNIKFVILMDAIEDRLKDLIVYINQNSQFDIYAVQMEYYKFEKYEIMIPKLFGVEVKKDISVNSSSNRQKWTESMLLEDAKKNYSGDEIKAFEKIYNFSKQYADEVRFGTGSHGSFSPIFNKISNKSLFTLGTNDRLSFNFEWIENKEFVKKYKEALTSIGFTIPDDYMGIRPSVRSDEWSPRKDDFIKMMENLISK